MQQDSDIDSSFDSSVALEHISRTESTCSLPPIPLQEQRSRAVAQPQAGLMELMMFTQTQPSGKLDSIEPAKEELFVGFMNGWKNKEIRVNQSKIKQAQRFMADSQLSIKNKDSISKPKSRSLLRSSSSSKQHKLFEQQPYSQWTMPCFKTMGRGLEVKISSAAKDKVNALFEQGSFKKPTKVKPAPKNDQNFVKTVNVQSKQKELFLGIKSKASPVKRESFNWEEYEKEFKAEFERESINISNRTTLGKKSAKKTPRIQTHKQIVFLKLADLKLTIIQQQQGLIRLASQSSNLSNRLWNHEQKNCHLWQCVLCKIKYNCIQIDSRQLLKVMNNQFGKRATEQLFDALLAQITFKLLRYQLLWPELINKRCQPGNLVVQLNRKLVQLEKDSDSSYLKQCLAQEQAGKPINLIVREKHHNSSMQIVFLKLSDGWMSVWSAIQSRNILYQYIIDNKRIKIGSKMSICLWQKHPIHNILDFCPLVKLSGACIEFFYNGSNLLPPNAKLGRPADIFYRPLHRCRMKGGILPLVIGTVLRIFTVKTDPKKKEIRRRGQDEARPNWASHFAEVISQEGYVCPIKFVLGEQGSLVEFLRLYHCYYFYGLKINEQKSLSFMMGNSKFDETSSKVNQHQQIYPLNVLLVLKQRLINLKSTKQRCENMLYDVLIEDGKLKYCEHSIDVEVQGLQTQKGSVLHQQVRLIGRSEDRLTFQKEKHSSQLRRVPKIYEKIVMM